MGNETTVPQQQQPLIPDKNQNVANGPIKTTQAPPSTQAETKKQVETKEVPTDKPKPNPSQTESKSQPPTDDPVPTTKSTKTKASTTSTEEKANPYAEEKSSKIQNEPKTKQSEKKEEPKPVKKPQPTSSTQQQQPKTTKKPVTVTVTAPKSSTTAPPKSSATAPSATASTSGTTTKVTQKTAPKVLKKPPQKKTKPKPKPKPRVAQQAPITSNYQPEKAPMDVKQKIEEYFHTSYPINITEDVFNTKNDLIRLRRYFHANPELSWQEIETGKNIANYCESLGLAVKKEVGRTGVVAVLHGNYGDGECIGLRADMDALPIQELNNDIAYKSRVKNVSHACGHDCHMAILLTVARILSQPKYVKQLHGCIKFIFQPAEEGGAGAKHMITDGVLDADTSTLNCPPVDQIYGLHVWSYSKLGKIVVKSGPLMAGSTKFNIKVKGIGGHGAEPKGTSDTVLALTQLSIQLHSIISRNLSPIDSGVLTIGTMNVGDAANIIAENGNITGTVRFLDNETFEIIKKRVREICEGVETSYCVEIDCVWGKNPYPPVINHERNTQYVQQAVNKVFPINENVQIDLTTMAAEDFSFYLNEKPGCFFFLGCGVDEYEGDDEKEQLLNNTPQKIQKNIEDGDEKVPKIYAHHTPNFKVDERCLIIGVQILVNLVMDLLIKPKQKVVEDNNDKNDVDLNDDEEELTQIEDYKKDKVMRDEVIEDKIIGNAPNDSK